MPTAVNPLVAPRSALRAQVLAFVRSGTALHPLYRDVALTGATVVMVSLASLLVISVVGRMGPEAMAEFLLIRRVGTTLLTAVLLGMSVGLPRFVAHAVNRSRERISFFFVALACVTVLTLACALVLNSARPAFARLFFGNASLANLIFPLSLLLIAYGGHNVVFGYYRGCLKMVQANALQVINFVVVPLATVFALWRYNSVPLLFFTMASAILVTDLAAAAPMLLRVRAVVSDKLVGYARQLLGYGIARVPGDIGTGALFSVGPIVLARYVSMTELGYLLLGLTVLNVVGTAVNPLNQVLLSKVSMILAEGRTSEARAYVAHLLSAVTDVGGYLSLQLIIFADVIVRVWVGSRYAGPLLVFRTLLLGIPLFLIYTSMRSVIDAASIKAYNARNIVIALAVFLGLLGLSIKLAPHDLLESSAAALVVALTVLAALTSRTVHLLYKVRMSGLRGSLLALVLGGVSLVLRRAFGPHISLFELIATQLIVGLVFLAILVRLRTEWLNVFFQTLLTRTAPAQEDSVNDNLASAS